jgi:hypothetical protein
MSSPNPDVSPVVGVDPAPRPVRRTFTAEYRNQMLDEYAAAPHGQKSALLRREGLYQSQLREWELARDCKPIPTHRRKVHRPIRVVCIVSLLGGVLVACTKTHSNTVSAPPSGSSGGTAVSATQPSSSTSSSALPDPAVVGLGPQPPLGEQRLNENGSGSTVLDLKADITAGRTLILRFVCSEDGRFLFSNSSEAGNNKVFGGGCGSSTIYSASLKASEADRVLTLAVPNDSVWRIAVWST